MINENKYTYIPLGLPNVQMELPAERPSPAPLPLITPFMAAMVEPLAMRHPEWRFVASFSDTLVSSFRVYQDRELLGTIRSGYRGYSSAYEITNHRTSKARQRSNSIMTKDPAKAMKTVEKYFTEKTIVEVMAEHSIELAKAVGALLMSAEAEVSRGMSQIIEPIRELLKAEWETIYPKLKEHGLNPSPGTDTMPEKFLRLEQMQRFRSGSCTAHVVLHNGKYFVSSPENSLDIQSYETIPDNLKCNLGLLKLVEDDTFLPDTGYRLNSKTFMVVVPEKNNGGENEVGNEGGEANV